MMTSVVYNFCMITEVSTLVNELPSVGEGHDDLTYSF
jgi:hypothetical protein